MHLTEVYEKHDSRTSMLDGCEGSSEPLDNGPHASIARVIFSVVVKPGSLGRPPSDYLASNYMTIK